MSTQPELPVEPSLILMKLHIHIYKDIRATSITGKEKYFLIKLYIPLPVVGKSSQSYYCIKKYRTAEFSPEQ